MALGTIGELAVCFLNVGKSSALDPSVFRGALKKSLPYFFPPSGYETSFLKLVSQTICALFS